ncbi:MAG: transcriptional regulator [Anaerolineae bacterium]
MSIRLVNRSERLTAIEQMLFRNTRGLRAVEIAQACGVDRRTIYRDLEMLESLGLPVTQSDGKFLLNRDYYLASVRINFNEAVALFLATRSYTRNATQQYPYIISAISKLCAALPEPLSTHVDYIADWMRANPVDRNHVQILETVIRGWVEKRIVKLWMSSTRDGEIQIRDFAVYFIEPTIIGDLCVVGRDFSSLNIKVCKLEHIKRIKLTETYYEIPVDFDRRSYLENMWGFADEEGRDTTRITLAFAPEVTPLIRERLWHASQRIDILPDKRCTLSIHIGDWRDLIPWLRSWGARVEVLEPNTLRHELAFDAMQVAQLYTAAVK